MLADMADTVSQPSTDARDAARRPAVPRARRPARVRPGDVEAFVGAPRIAVLAYVRADGRPGQAPIWYRVDGARFFMSTVTGSPKHRALRRDPRICLTIQDERPPYRAVLADGEAVPRALPARETDGISALRYFGRVAARAYATQTAELYAARRPHPDHARPSGAARLRQPPRAERRDARGFGCATGCRRRCARSDRGLGARSGLPGDWLAS